MESKDILELEEELKTSKITPSEIDKKRHPKFGAVLSKKMAITALVGAILGTAGILGANAISVWAQNFAGVWGSSLGNIFGNGLEYALKGIASATAEAGIWSAGALALGLTPNAIRGIVNYNKYKKYLDVSLTKEELERVAANELDKEAVITENLINKISTSTYAQKSIFAKAQSARNALNKTNNPFKKIGYQTEKVLNEDLVNKSIKTLVERLNTLSVEKSKDWETIVENNQGLLVKSRYSDLQISNKLKEMDMIQKFFVKVLDKADKRDPYYACLKHYLKKYHKTIELINLPEDDATLRNTFKNDIADELKAGRVANAIKNFCTYTQMIPEEQLNSLTPLASQMAKNMDLRSAKEAELGALKEHERVKSIRFSAEQKLAETDRILLDIQANEIKAKGSADRLSNYENYFAKRNQELDNLLAEWKTIRNNALKEYQTIVDNSELSKKHSRELKEILVKAIQDGESVESAVNKIRGILAQADQDNLAERLEQLIDLAFMSEGSMQAIIKNKEQSDKIVGRLGTQLGTARKNAKATRTLRTQVEDDAVATRTARTTAEDEATSATKARKSAQLNESIINTLVGKSQIATTESEENAKISRRNAKATEEDVKITSRNTKLTKEHLNTTSKNAKDTEEHAKITAKNAKATEEDAVKTKKNAEITDENVIKTNKNVETTEENAKISSENVAKIEKIVERLEAIKIEDVENIQANIKKAFDEIARITGEQSNYAHNLDVEACYELLGREINNIYQTLKDVDLLDMAKRVQGLQRAVRNQKQKLNKFKAEQNERFNLLAESITALRSIVYSDDILIERLNKIYKSKDVVSKFKMLLNAVDNSGVKQDKLEEFASWTQNDLDKLTAVVNNLSNDVIRLTNEVNNNPNNEQEEQEKSSTPKYNVPDSENLANLKKTFKAYIHAIHRALKDNKTLPETATSIMRGRKKTQEEIAEQGGSNLDFSSKGKFRKNVTELCKDNLSANDFKEIERLSKLELIEFEDSDLEEYIGLVEKACQNYNAKINDEYGY